jgi:hypothetical protein
MELFVEKMMGSTRVHSYTIITLLTHNMCIEATIAYTISLSDF